jgi:outer membrane protein
MQNKKALKKLLVGVAASALITMSANADSFKLGYIDVAKIFTTSKVSIAMQAALKTKFEPQQLELKKLNDNLVKEQGQIQDIEKTAPSMDKLTASNRANLEKLGKQYQKDQMMFQQKYSMFQQTVQKTQDYASALLLGKINTILKKISDAGNYDLVLTSNQMVYAKAKYDLTDQVIEDLKSVNGDQLVKQMVNAEAAANQPSSDGLKNFAAPSAAAPSVK